MERHKKCNCYLGECAESDHYLLSSSYFLCAVSSFPLIAGRVMKGKSINFFPSVEHFGRHSLSHSLIASSPSPHTSQSTLFFLQLPTSSLWGSNFEMLMAQKRDCSLLVFTKKIYFRKNFVSPQSHLSAPKDENMAVKYKYFYANHIICSLAFFILRSPFSSINWLSFLHPFAWFPC